MPDTTKEVQPRFLAFREQTGMTLAFWNEEELLGFIIDSNQSEWKLFRVGEELQVKTFIEPVTSIKI
jgi:hypothetical protein